MKQVIELLDRFDLRKLVKPLTRCARCNGLVEAVAKDQIEHDLPPRTRQHYQSFHKCSGCGNIYWRGAHAAALDAWISQIADGVRAPA